MKSDIEFFAVTCLNWQNLFEKEYIRHLVLVGDNTNQRTEEAHLATLVWFHTVATFK